METLTFFLYIIGLIISWVIFYYAVKAAVTNGIREARADKEAPTFIRESKFEKPENAEKTTEFADNYLPHYRESEPVEDWDILKGRRYIIQIIFENGTSHNIYQNCKTGKYFYIHSANGITYCDNKEDCISKLYNHVMQRI